MATLSLFEKSNVFQYGFLTSRVSRLLETFQKEIRELDPDDRRTIEAAEDFIKHVLNGQQLIAGKKSGFSPSIEGLEAFGYAINTIQLLKDDLDKEPNTHDEIKAIFQKVERVLDNILEKKSPTTDDLIFTERFFSLIADRLLEDARTLVRPKPPLLTYR